MVSAVTVTPGIYYWVFLQGIGVVRYKLMIVYVAVSSELLLHTEELIKGC